MLAYLGDERDFFGADGFYTLTGNAGVSILASSPLGDTMARSRDLLRASSAVVLSFGLIAASISTASTSASAPGFGTVVSAEHAHVGRAAASIGTTIFSGDSLDTEQFGSMQVRAGAARLMLSGASRVTWGTEEGAAAATLKNGTAIFSTANSKAFALHASSAVIRPNSDAPTIGKVTIVSAKELTVSCSRGTLAISVDDDTKTIAEGTAYRVVLDPDQQQASDNSGAQSNSNGKPKQPRKAGKDRFLLFVIIFGGAATGVGLYYALESPDKP